MKFTDVSSFLSKKKGNVFLVIINSPSERAGIIKKLIPTEHQIEKFLPDIQMCTLFDALLSPPLFGGEMALILDECELLKKRDIEKLSDFLERNDFPGILIFGAKSKTPLCDFVEKTGSVLDMSGEKPWDRERRLSDLLIGQAKDHGKWLSKDAAQLLLEKVGPEFDQLTNEVLKLSCFVGDRPNIERADVFRMTGTSANETHWKVAEEIVWDGGGSSFDPSSFIGLIFSLRSQLQMGAKITDLNKQKVPFNEWTPFFPKLWPKTLEKRRGQAISKGSRFFEQGLDTLFKVECMSRRGAHPQELFDFFRSSLNVNG